MVASASPPSRFNFAGAGQQVKSLPVPATTAPLNDDLSGTTTPLAPPTDGRNARALRTREAIVDACISLVEQGELRPTAPVVAERASVSVRSVFQHFDDLPSLHMAVAQRIAERIAVLLVPTDPAQPFDDRVTAFVRHRAALLEAITPYRRAANVHGPFALEIRESVRASTEYLRGQVANTFHPELDQLPADERQQVLDGLAMILSWPAWEALRSENGCTVEGASAVTERMVRGLLAST